MCANLKRRVDILKKLIVFLCVTIMFSFSMLEHGVNDTLWRRGLCSSTEAYSGTVKVDRIDFPWRE